MPRFYFDLHNDEDLLDQQGRELSGLADAKAEAMVEAREMICASVAEGKIDLRHHIDVRDEGGAIVHQVPFEDAVVVLRAGAPV